MTYKNGFLTGNAAGVFITLTALGKIIVVDYTESFRAVAFFVLFCVFVFGSFISAYSAVKGHCCFSTSRDGFISGIAFIEGIIVFLLYGFKL
jgi:hypothetical protein